MSKEKNEQNEAPAEKQVVVSESVLQGLVFDVLKQLAQSNQALAESMKNINKPYVDEKQAENEAAMRESMKRTEYAKKINLKASQKNCIHMQGCHPLSEFSNQNGLTAIIWHTFDPGVYLGLCTVCGRKFVPGDADYNEWVRRPSANRPSSSGWEKRRFSDPTARQEAFIKEIAAQEA